MSLLLQRPKHRIGYVLLLSILLSLSACPGGSAVPSDPVLDGAPMDHRTLDLMSRPHDGPGFDKPRPVDSMSAVDSAPLPPDSAPLQPDAFVPSFGDVTPTTPHYNAIIWVAQQGIMTGCKAPPPLFCPQSPLLRSEAATALMRMKHGPSFTYSKTPHFPDVPATHWAFQYIQRLFEDGITAGFPDGTFRPDDATTRAMAATFLVRAKYGPTFSYSQTPHYTDVPATDWAFKYVQKATDTGLVVGQKPGIFGPTAPMLRLYWALMLYRVQSL